MRGWVLVAVVLLSGSSSRTLAGGDGTPFTLGRQGGVLVPAALNGAGPFVLLLDTGASHSSVSEELARELGAPAIARTTVQSPAGDRERLVVRIDRILLGPIAVAAAPTAVPRGDLAIAGDVHGVLGQDVLAGLRYTIDYRNRRIVWHAREPEVSRSIAVLPMAFRDGLPFVDLPQNGLTLRLVADSGAGGLVLFGGGGRDLPAMTPDGGVVRISTFQGRGQARGVRTKQEIFEALWPDTAVTDHALTRVVAQLRRVLGDEARQARYLETVPTRGYRWIHPVEEGTAPEVTGDPGEAAASPVRRPLRLAIFPGRSN